MDIFSAMLLALLIAIVIFILISTLASLAGLVILIKEKGGIKQYFGVLGIGYCILTSAVYILSNVI